MRGFKKYVFLPRTEILNTLKTTRNSRTALNLKLSNKTASITFKNNNTLELDWREFCILREFAVANPEAFTQLHIKKEGSQFFVEAENYKVSGSASMLYQILLGYLLYQKLELTSCISECGLVSIKSPEQEFRGSINILVVLNELKEGMYNANFKGKNVLDIGGFQGETAIYFSTQGASKVIVYEPVPGNCQLIKENLFLNQIDNVDLQEAGVSDVNGSKTIHYDQFELDFGYKNAGLKELTFKVESIAEVLQKTKPDIAKIDCEGAEQYLVDVRNDVLRATNFYMIEAHQKWIRTALISKFTQAGFKLMKEKRVGKNVTVVYFVLSS